MVTRGGSERTANALTRLPRLHFGGLILTVHIGSGLREGSSATFPAVRNTTDLHFRDLWLRPALAPRDRSLVTVSAVIASGQVAQITYHLNRAMDNGLTQPQVLRSCDLHCFLRGLAKHILCSTRRKGSF